MGFLLGCLCMQRKGMYYEMSGKPNFDGNTLPEPKERSNSIRRPNTISPLRHSFQFYPPAVSHIALKPSKPSLDKGLTYRSSRLSQLLPFQRLLSPLLFSDSHHDGSQILPTSDESVPASGDSVPAIKCHFRPPRSEPRPAPQTSTNSAQNSLPGYLNLDANANEEPLVEEEVDNLHDASVAQSHRERKTTEFWADKIIDSDGTIKPAKLSIVLKFNNAKQAIGDEARLLSGVLGLLGSDYGKFSICRKSWRQIITKDKVYNKCVKVKVYIPGKLNLLIFKIIDNLYYLCSKFSTLMKTAKELQEK
ncbi:hypothetical protein Ahy_A09g044911 [Arachis hypogaea]|uniref:Uncharacterized protein n=1 Tax=Arachis hypogaea TaxID=3818 RepID=A0A445BL30_ARAHY|nr:hypothetical protein Ahy_A09g044911 [Arachis hypogaea]